MAKNIIRTGKKGASAAGKALRNPKSSALVKMLAAEAEENRKAKTKGKRKGK